MTIHPIMISDWLPKLGRQAFLAWVQFHSWKDPGVDQHQPFIIHLPLTKLIKQLRVGNSTFYDKILRPLWNYGLINLHHAKKGGHHIRLIVYSTPPNYEENMDKPLELLRDYDEDLTLTSILPKTEPIPKSSPNPQVRSVPFQSNGSNLKELQPEVVPLHTLNGHIPSTGISPDAKTATTLPTQRTMEKPLPIQEDHPASFNQDHLRSKEDKRDKKDKEIDLDLPQEIQTLLNRNKSLQERWPQILSVYHKCKEHPHFTPAAFCDKLEYCMRYPHNKAFFRAYLHKALLNEWKNPLQPKKKQPAKPKQSDVPVWITQQDERYPQRKNERNNGLTPEQQAEIDRLLKALMEVQP